MTLLGVGCHSQRVKSAEAPQCRRMQTGSAAGNRFRRGGAAAARQTIGKHHGLKMWLRRLISQVSRRRAGQINGCRRSYSSSGPRKGE